MKIAVLLPAVDRGESRRWLAWDRCRYGSVRARYRHRPGLRRLCAVCAGCEDTRPSTNSRVAKCVPAPLPDWMRLRVGPRGNPSFRL